MSRAGTGLREAPAEVLKRMLQFAFALFCEVISKRGSDGTTTASDRGPVARLLAPPTDEREIVRYWTLSERIWTSFSETQ